MIVRCPWLDRTLSPNSRKHWRAKADATARYLRACWAAAREAGAKDCHVGHEGRIPVHLTFCHPTARQWDDDNLEATFKAGRDGVAKAMGVDDKRFQVTRSIGEKVKGGCVIVEIKAGEAE
jgi:crossover junction endodeoxyribonuclease RusA